MSRKRKTTAINNIVVVSDLHVGSLVGLMQPSGMPMDEGMIARPSRQTKWLWQRWQEFWAWIKEPCHGEPYAVVVNGDALDGAPHGSKAEATHNLAMQRRAAYDILKPIVEACEGRYYHIRGTEAHVGKSSEEEESLAEALGAIPDEDGRRARYELWIRIGVGNAHFAHHIGTTSSMAYETSAVQKELQESYSEAARWGHEPPNVIVRSHRHRMVETRIASSKGYAIACVTAGWQLKTPFAYKIPGGRVAAAQVGGTVVRCGDKDVYTRHKVWGVPHSREERPNA